MVDMTEAMQTSIDQYRQMVQSRAIRDALRRQALDIQRQAQELEPVPVSPTLGSIPAWLADPDWIPTDGSYPPDMEDNEIALMRTYKARQKEAESAQLRARILSESIGNPLAGMTEALDTARVMEEALPKDRMSYPTSNDNKKKWRKRR